MDLTSRFTEIQDKVFSMEHAPVLNIYADMELLQDLKFGALLTMLSTEDEAKYLYTKLSVYNTRIDNELCKYFPALGIKEEQITERLADTAFAPIICKIAPFTEAYDIFTTFLGTALKHNQVLGDTRPVTLTINISDIVYPKRLLSAMSNNLQTMFPGIAVNFTTDKRYGVDIAEFLHNDTFFLFDVPTLLADSSATSVAFVQNGAFFGKKVFSVPYLDTTLHTEEKDYTNILVSTEYGLNIYCDFKYISPAITVKESDNG